jgi:hypothetical protein
MRICSVMPHDSAAGEGAQIINPLRLGTVLLRVGAGSNGSYKTLSATAFAAFVNLMHVARFFQFGARKSHP